MFLVIILVGVEDLSVLALFFEGEVPSRSSRFLTLTFFAKLVSLLLHILLFWSVSSIAYSRSTPLLSGGALCWTEKVLHFQQKSLFAHLNFGLSLFRFYPCTIVNMVQSIDELRQKEVGNHVPLLSFCFKTQRKGTKLLFVLLEEAIAELIREVPGVSIKINVWKGAGLRWFLTNTSAV